MNRDFLKAQPLFAGLSGPDLDWLAEQVQAISISAGEFLILEGEPGDSAYIVVKGEFEIVKKSDQREIVIAVREPGAVIGEMALIDNTPRVASVRAVTNGNLLKISDTVFIRLLEKSATAVMAILRTVSGRLRQNEAMLRQSEKMAALGTLSAGLAHELNNPASAARRSADQLRAKLNNWQQLNSELDQIKFDEIQRGKLSTLRMKMGDRHEKKALRDPFAQSELENEIQSWLADRGVQSAWEISSELASAGFDTTSLSDLCETYTPKQLNIVVNWLAVGFTVHALIDEVRLSTERISEIVKSVKEYSYLDQAPLQEVDVHEGLNNTLVILRHKLKEGIQISKQYESTLPRIEAYGSELNQVWTNILDNAIDALPGKGVITIRTYSKDSHIYVEISDNGPGIPVEIQKRIFEPFFTTKPPGVGTGLGLHISYSIIHKHYGEIRVMSHPGETCFQVKLPISLPRN
ncbi:MAG: hypothetical protein A2Y54_04555 [Chloroflexi bacterium RBG_16_51_16]|nr:MAG: hypothetical protein A2Y54_04555 [Chloroflexi bacterium RBG_16_51_16]